MRITIRWISNPHEAGYWRSVEGRFDITPHFWGRTRPQSYTLADNTNQLVRTYPTVRAAKADAAKRIAREVADYTS